MHWDQYIFSSPTLPHRARSRPQTARAIGYEHELGGSGRCQGLFPGKAQGGWPTAHDFVTKAVPTARDNRLKSCAAGTRFGRKSCAPSPGAPLRRASSSTASICGPKAAPSATTRMRLEVHERSALSTLPFPCANEGCLSCSTHAAYEGERSRERKLKLHTRVLHPDAVNALHRGAPFMATSYSSIRPNMS